MIQSHGEPIEEEDALEISRFKSLRAGIRAHDALITTVSELALDEQRLNVQRIELARMKHAAWTASEESDRRIANKKLEAATDALSHRHRVLSWQATSTVVLFIFAHLMLLTAVAVALLEFKRARKMGTPEAGAEISASAQGFAIKTARTGALLLLGAMVLYFLYMKFAYPISTVS